MWPFLETPSVVIDLDRLERNILTMAEGLATNGTSLRPHVKTHKSTRIAAMQVAHGASGISTATVGEAEAMSQAGIDDIFIAYPVYPMASRRSRLHNLADNTRLRVGVDSVDAARELGAVMNSSHHELEVCVEIDSGLRRSGVHPEAALEVVAAASDVGLRIVGVFTHGGHSNVPGRVDDGARDEVENLSTAAVLLQDAGLDISVVSVPSGDRFVIDCGSKTLSSDRQPWIEGFGWIPEVGTSITRLSEEHGVVEVASGTRIPPIGHQLAVVPNHVCPVVNLTDRLVVAREGEQIDEWSVDARRR